ncbi:MAG: FtsX-like permease family protein [Parachlamydiaceae bacterium]|nr:FtsX-like permease family protein [Parachlamydiaceae bacterium]
MFEFSVACKYLIPRRRQLSVSIISLISVFVIALVVWLIVVFFSVTNGLEKNWINKLTTLTAPVRITPTDAYFHSYYHEIDKVSAASEYSTKSIGEKIQATQTDPYDPEMDQELPASFPSPDLDTSGNLKDPVKLVFDSINEIRDVPGLYAKDFELTASNIQLDLFRQTSVFQSNHIFGTTSHSVLNYPIYLGNFEEGHTQFGQTLLPIRSVDFNNLLQQIRPQKEEFSLLNNEQRSQDPTSFNQRINDYFQHIQIQQLKTRPLGWSIPSTLLPLEAQWKGYAIFNENKIIRFIVPLSTKELSLLKKSLEEQGLKSEIGFLTIKNGKFSFSNDLKTPGTPLHSFKITLAGDTSFHATLIPESLSQAKELENLRFKIDFPVQGVPLKGIIPFRGLDIGAATMIHQNDTTHYPLWVYQKTDEKGQSSWVLPIKQDVEGIILPKGFREAGVMLGDKGSLSYLSPSASHIEEEHLPVYVAGFYDPGIIPIGGKFILANRDLTTLIRGAHQSEDASLFTNGINVRFENLNDADKVKAELKKAFQNKGIGHYWNIETFREYEFTKEMMQELQSQKNLFMVIAIVIIIVACSNIISMLIILVNDKKVEIGILRSMGATSKNIALIFGLSGALIGVMGSFTGIIGAVITLHSLDSLIYLLSQLQGHEMFNASFYGQILPNELSMEALSFVLLATLCISLIAGIVPAIKACLLRPAQILRSGAN